MVSGFKILVIDDFATMRRIIRGLLKDIGYAEIDETEDATTALAKLKSEHFDFAIIDATLPDIDGWTLTEKIRADSALAKLPILLVLAEANKEAIVRASQVGAHGYIIKPFTRAALEEKIINVNKKVAASS